jgi:hypothetical protein
MRIISIHILFAVLALGIGGNVHATVSLYGIAAEWRQAVNHSFTTIDFTDYPEQTPISNQYIHHGVSFGVAPNLPWIIQGPSFPDGHGLIGFNDNPFWLDFTEPVHSLATDYIGSIAFRLYSGGELIHSTNVFLQSFIGLVSSLPFDRVEVYRPTGFNPVIDNLFFGPPIPAPGALALLGVAALGIIPRRHRQV